MFYVINNCWPYLPTHCMGGSVWTAEYTDCISAERYGHPGYDTKLSDGDALLLELWGMLCTPLPSFPGPLWPGVATLDRIRSIDQIELNCN